MTIRGKEAHHNGKIRPEDAGLASRLTTGLRPVRLASAAAILFLFGGAGLVGAQSDSRERASFTFDEERPDSGTGLHLDIEYSNPEDPAAKPYAVETVVEELAPGSRIDTSVPERCIASDSELTNQGPSACPPGSHVGVGKVVLDSGIEGPARLLEFDVTEFNADHELILLFEASNGSGVRSVSRSPVDERTITAGAPPLPGGPPDGYTAIKSVHLALDSVSAPVGSGATPRHYITTPPSCPREGAWNNEITFTYRDGQTSAASTPSPCDGGKRPRVKIRNVPEDCIDHGLRARVRIELRSTSPLRRVVARLDGKVVRKTDRKRFTVHLRDQALRDGPHRLTVVAQDESGVKGKHVARFRSC